MRNISALVAGIAIAMIAGAVTAAIRIGRPPEPQVQVVDSRALDIDLYFAKRHMPLAGYGASFVLAADANGIDWRLLPAIAVRESSGGLQACGNNPFGWNSCKGRRGAFKSTEEAIQQVAANLGGNVTSTRAYYAGKTTKQKLNAYNPPSIVPEYTPQVIDIMQKIHPDN